MTDPMLKPPAQLKGLGWQWTAKGPIVCVQVDGKRHCVLVPLSMIWATFDQHARAVGAPLQMTVGDPLSVDGFFMAMDRLDQPAVGYSNWWGVADIPYLLDRLKPGPLPWTPRALEWPNAHGTGKYHMEYETWLRIHPWSRPILWEHLSKEDQKYLLTRWPLDVLMTKHPPSSFGNFVRSAGRAVESAVTEGVHIAKAVVKAQTHLVKGALHAVTNNPVWDIVATGASFIPGIGSAVSAGMATAAAVGRGLSLKDAAILAAKNALPGGPLAAAAIDVAIGVAQGHKIDEIALSVVRDQLPGGHLEKAIFDTTIAVAKGKKITPANIAALGAAGLGHEQAQALITNLSKSAALRGHSPEAKAVRQVVKDAAGDAAHSIVAKHIVPHLPAVKTPQQMSQAHTAAAALLTKLHEATQSAQRIARGHALPSDHIAAAQASQVHEAIKLIAAKAKSGDQHATNVLAAMNHLQNPVNLSAYAEAYAKSYVARFRPDLKPYAEAYAKQYARSFGV